MFDQLYFVWWWERIERLLGLLDRKDRKKHRFIWTVENTEKFAKQDNLRYCMSYVKADLIAADIDFNDGNVEEETT